MTCRQAKDNLWSSNFLHSNNAKFACLLGLVANNKARVHTCLTVAYLTGTLPGGWGWGYCHTWDIQVCAAVKGLVFKQLSLGQCIEIRRLEVQNRVSIDQVINCLKILARLRKPGIDTQKHEIVKSSFTCIQFQNVHPSVKFCGKWRLQAIGWEEILGTQSSLGQQNSVTYNRVRVPGSQRAAHPYLSIPYPRGTLWLGVTIEF